MWVAFVKLCIYNGRLDRASKFMKLFFTDMMIISGININDYKEIDSDYYEYPWVENGEANVQIYKRLIRLDERNFLRGLEQGWGGVGLRTDIEKKIHIMFACGVQEVWKKTDFIIKFINISFLKLIQVRE